MKNSLIRTINSEMNSYLNNYQLEKLNEILEYNLYNYDVIEIEENKKELFNTPASDVSPLGDIFKQMFNMIDDVNLILKGKKNED